MNLYFDEQGSQGFVCDIGSCLFHVEDSKSIVDFVVDVVVDYILKKVVVVSIIDSRCVGSFVLVGENIDCRLYRALLSVVVGVDCIVDVVVD